MYLIGGIKNFVLTVTEKKYLSMYKKKKTLKRG